MAIKVLHILGNLAIGGAENLVLDMIRHGRGVGMEFYTVYMSKSPQERINQFIDAGTGIKYIQCTKGIKGTFSFICGLRNYLKMNNIHIIHCHNNINAYWAFIASRALGCKIILTVHGFNNNLNYLGDKIPKFLNFSPDKYILNRCSFVFVSEKTKDFYCKKYKNWDSVNKAPVIYNGIDANKILSASKIDIYDGEKQVFAMVGSFNSPAKRQQIIICKAIGELKKRIANAQLPFKFAFIGAPNSEWKEGDLLEDGAYNTNDMYAACRLYCAKNALDNDVMFIPPRSDVPGIMRNLACYVYASEDDTFGLSVIEAVIAGVPVICSNIPTFVEVTHNGMLAQLVPNNTNAFANAIYNFIVGDTCPLNLDLKTQAALKNYSINICLEKYNTLFYRG
ncbi:MAG: glycosyltransferase family 4 protein [Bacteroidales bacterium]